MSCFVIFMPSSATILAVMLSILDKNSCTTFTCIIGCTVLVNRIFHSYRLFGISIMLNFYCANFFLPENVAWSSCTCIQFQNSKCINLQKNVFKIFAYSFVFFFWFKMPNYTCKQLNTFCSFIKHVNSRPKNSQGWANQNSVTHLELTILNCI